MLVIKCDTILPLRRYDKSSHIMYQISHGGYVLVTYIDNMMFHAVLYV